MKDNFSHYAKDYAKYRPTYPSELYKYLFSVTTSKDLAWDCGTGNGQVAVELAKVFKNVWATDLSPEQIEYAPKLENINYEIRLAEDTIDQKQTIDLVTVAQAIHWFDFEKFYKNVKQVLKPNGIIAVIGYSVLRADDQFNEVIRRFYKEITDLYWDEERKYLDEDYLTIPFPFKEEVVPKMEIKVKWNKEQLFNYLNTWSAVKHFEKEQGMSPLNLIKEETAEKWGDLPEKEFIFPVLLRVGRV
ncbi:MAG: class I SAM-dependent methyltransferase [Leeuwenhoekiella sp.]